MIVRNFVGAVHSEILFTNEWSPFEQWAKLSSGTISHVFGFDDCIIAWT